MKGWFIKKKKKNQLKSKKKANVCSPDIVVKIPLLWCMYTSWMNVLYSHLLTEGLRMVAFTGTSNTWYCGDVSAVTESYSPCSDTGPWMGYSLRPTLPCQSLSSPQHSVVPLLTSILYGATVQMWRSQGGINAQCQGHKWSILPEAAEETPDGRYSGLEMWSTAG